MTPNTPETSTGDFMAFSYSHKSQVTTDLT